MNCSPAMQVFEGLMLGDGSLVLHGRSAYFSLGLSAGDPNQWRDTLWNGRESKIPQMEYLVHIMGCLRPLGITFSAGYPKAHERIAMNGKPYLYCCIESSISDFLFTQWERWYRPVTDEVRKTRWFAGNRKWYKILPEGIKLTPTVLAVWFEGDGSTVWNPYPWVQLLFCTNSFTKKEVEKLGGLFLPFGIQTGVKQHLTKRQMTWYLTISAIDSVNTFFDLTAEHIHPCYSSKIKRPKHASECSTEEEKRGICRYNKYQRDYKRKWYKKERDKLLPPDPLFSNLRTKLKGRAIEDGKTSKDGKESPKRQVTTHPL